MKRTRAEESPNSPTMESPDYPATSMEITRLPDYGNAPITRLWKLPDYPTMAITRLPDYGNYPIARLRIFPNTRLRKLPDYPIAILPDYPTMDFARLPDYEIPSPPLLDHLIFLIAEA